MTDSLAVAMYETVREYGESILSTPRTFEIVVSGKTLTTPKELEALSAALSNGLVADLWHRRDAEIAPMAVALASRSGVPLSAARWSLELWKSTLTHIRDGTKPPQVDWTTLRLEPAPRRWDRAPISVIAIICVAIVGAIAGAMPGLLCGIGIERGDPQAQKFRALVEKHELPGTRMAPREFATWTGGLGGLGGMIGAVVGWLVIVRHPLTWTNFLAGIIGALWAFDAAAFGMAQLGLTGVFAGPLLVTIIAVMVAGRLGPFACLLLAKPLAWAFIAHF